jgi:trimeric autotransporter adhesin
MKAVWSIAKALVVATLGLTSACDGILGIPGGDFMFGGPDPDAGPDAGDVMPDAGDVTPDARDVRPDAGSAVIPDGGPPMPDGGPPPPDARVEPPDLLLSSYVKASNTGLGDQFGWQVALWGDIMAVSAYREDSLATGVGGNQGNDNLPNSGAVYVFRRSGASWQQEAFLKASNPDDSDEFGYTLALWDDTLAVGAWGERSATTGIDGNQSDNSARDAGAVYVFRRTDTTWAQEAYVKPSNTGQRDEFGASLALWEDTLAVGAPEEDSSATGVDGNQLDENAADSGAVYVFRRTGTDWAQEAYIKASNTEEFDEFGVGVALYGDTLAVSAYLEDSGAPGVGGEQGDRSAIDSGAVYVFRRTGTEWAQEAYVKASNPGDNDQFGWKIALWEDTLAVSALLEDSSATGVNGNQGDNAASDSGAVYVFRHDGASWAQDVYLKASNTGAGDQFGASLALAGNVLVAGAPLEDSRGTEQGGSPDENGAGDSGAAYLFQRPAGAWTPPLFVKAGVADAGDRFGSSVAIVADMLVTGAQFEDSASQGLAGNPDDNGVLDSGAGYVFDY